MKHPAHSRGYILLEAIIALALFGVFVATVIPTVGFLFQRSRGSQANTDANLLLQEGMEISYDLMIAHWDNYPPGMYVKSIDMRSGNPQWELVAGDHELIEAKYTRTIEIKPISRNPSTGSIGSGTVDPNSRMVETTIQWNDRGQEQSLKADLFVFNMH